MKQLSLHQEYSRGDVHDIFAPDTPFTPQTGSWGLHGIVKIPDRPDDFVFFVTYGQQQGEHVFDEGITEDGVLSWQSQPRQSLANSQILQFISHDELIHSIYLFLRTSRDSKYTYLGQLKYLSHDLERENPVYFQWQILDWPPPTDVIKQMGLEFTTSGEILPELSATGSGQLLETPPPQFQPRKGISTTIFRVHKNVDYSIKDARNKKLGLSGELIVLEYEKHKLQDHNRADLASKVRHVSQIEGDGAGYDIESYSVDGTIRYIEVKTSKGSIQTPFYMSSNEVQFSKEHRENYHLYRVYDYDPNTKSGKLYITKGNVEDFFKLTPIQYRVG